MVTNLVQIPSEHKTFTFFDSFDVQFVVQLPDRRLLDSCGSIHFLIVKQGMTTAGICPKTRKCYLNQDFGLNDKKPTFDALLFCSINFLSGVKAKTLKARCNDTKNILY